MFLAASVVAANEHALFIYDTMRHHMQRMDHLKCELDRNRGSTFFVDRYDTGEDSDSDDANIEGHMTCFSQISSKFVALLYKWHDEVVFLSKFVYHVRIMRVLSCMSPLIQTYARVYDPWLFGDRNGFVYQGCSRYLNYRRIMQRATIRKVDKDEMTSLLDTLETTFDAEDIILDDRLLFACVRRCASLGLTSPFAWCPKEASENASFRYLLRRIGVRKRASSTTSICKSVKFNLGSHSHESEDYGFL